MKNTLYSSWGISNNILTLSEELEESCEDRFKDIEEIRAYNQLKVLRAFQSARMAEADLGGSSGYGYDDNGRTKLERIYAEVFGAEAALVRWQISSGTHALTLCLFGVLRPGDEVLSATGELYDTLQTVLGNKDSGRGSLKDFGISYRAVSLGTDGKIDVPSVVKAISENTKMIWIQRSRGYENRPAVAIQEMRDAISAFKAVKPDVIVCVDNCYGEFVELQEPCEVGADLIAGSLIKNPGGGLAQTGGYVAGKRDLVELAAERLTAPGVGSEIGPTMGITRQLAQGFYQAPHVVGECLKGLVFTSALLEAMGCESFPGPWEHRADIVQVLRFSSAEGLVSFCRSIQSSSPVDSFVTPVPAEMPGYDSPVVMAAGAFVQGSSMELSADGPLREPYQAFMQGGIVYENIKLAAMLAAENMRERG